MRAHGAGTVGVRAGILGAALAAVLGTGLALPLPAWARPAPEGAAAGAAAPQVQAPGPPRVRTPAPSQLSLPHNPAPASSTTSPPGEPSAQPAPAPPSPTDSPAPTATATAPFDPPGRDVSFPQCGQELPERAAFVVVGVTGGLVRTGNPCLGDLLGWALAATDAPVAYYVNTANPGPLVSSYWPDGQAAPRVCAVGFPADDSVDCAYDYGWNAALDAFARALAAAADAGAPGPETADWWLDVETTNSWQALSEGGDARTYAADAAALQGMVDALHAQGVAGVGVYSTAEQWQQVTGGADLGGVPVWYAGLGSADLAQAQCDPAGSFTGGPVVLSQYLLDGLDADLRC